MILTGSIIIFFYTLFMAVLYWAYGSVSSNNSEQHVPKTRFTIIIPFRNEASFIPKLLDSLQQIEYHSELFEIVFIDDESTDRSAEIISKELNNSRLNFSIINNERHTNSPKKDAITLAVKNSQFEWIITTDADCIISSNLLIELDNSIQSNGPVMLVGPLTLIKGKGLKYQFQNFENLALQTLSVGGFGIQRPFLCNGANLAYTKVVFNAVDGYKGNDHISSGDDIFLFEKIRNRYPDEVQFLRTMRATVYTHPVNKWKDIIGQRIRWASKTSKQKNSTSWIIGFTTLLTNLFIIAGLVYCLFNIDILTYFLLFFFFKTLVDLIIISRSTQFFKKRIHFLMFLMNSLIYPFVTLLVLIGSLKGTYKWKGRRFSKY